MPLNHDADAIELSEVMLVQRIGRLLAVGMVAFLAWIFIFSFGSSCACVPADISFAEFLNIPIHFTQDTVTLGLAKKYQIGSELTLDWLLELGEERALTSRGDSVLFECWLESSAVAKRGYLITFELSHDNKISNIKVNKISSWFGYKTMGKQTMTRNPRLAPPRTPSPLQTS